ncbi:hypothetical protein [Hazenella coriacea]|uniref:WXG100 family type VII secretion target n=1 Tax=Hazenella coriacea TaxID=1179467 RepID=A0A4R3LEJ3_9BACL|nr:hypothetical protein [Hazenella coriacea]TCS96764.1 hypothetical protein EDD58_101405 [Hazenella coriacea]
MDAHVSLEALEKFKRTLTQFSQNMSVEAQKMQLHLKKTHEQLQQKHFKLKRQLQMYQDPVSYERAKQQLVEFERLFAGFCQAAQECIKGFQQQELMAANRQKAVVTIDRKVGVLKEYLGSGAREHGKNQMSLEENTSKGIDNVSVNRNNNLYRGDSLLHSPTRPNGIGKPHISSSGNLVPANKDGLYKGRQVTVTEHILGGYRKGAKSNSPFTSFTNNKNVIGNYGDNAIELDISTLRKAIQSGEVKDVVILSPKQVQKLIERDVISSDFWKKEPLVGLRGIMNI